MAGVAGRSGKRMDSLWADAIRRAIKRREEKDPLALERMAEVLLNKVVEGDMAAIKELGDRIDGKAAIQVTHEGGETPVQMKIIAVWGGTKEQDDTGGTGH